MEGAVRIAITDDEAGMRNSLSFLLEQEGFSVVTFENGLQLLQAMSEIRFDLFLLDVCMPEMDGFQLLDRILESDAHAPVVMMTGQASIESAVRALKKGACDYLRKPFEHEDLVKTVRNVLGQKRLKDENKAISDRLAVSEKRYRYIVQNSPDIIYTLDPDGTCTFMNEAVERVLGYRPESLIGTRFEDLIHPDDVEKSRWLFEERRCDERAAAGIEIRLMCHGNPQNYRHCLIKQLTVPSASSENPAGKGKRCIYGVARDFSYRRLLEIQLREAQKMEAIGTLAGGIAHDFNNMLMCIQGYTSLMLSSLDPGNSFYDKLLNVEHNIQLGAELTGQLLGFARSGKYHVRPMDINELVKRTAEMFGRTKKEVIIHQRLRKDLWTALADEGQIEQVLLNLYVNAWQAMPGGGEIYLDTENEPLVGHGLEKIGLKPGNYIKISVTDTGAGMDEKIRSGSLSLFLPQRKGAGEPDSVWPRLTGSLKITGAASRYSARKERGAPL